MTALTQQKMDLTDILTRLVLAEYDRADPSKQQAIVSGLVRELADKMTMRELRAWHQGIAISQYVNSLIHEEAQCSTPN